MSILPIKINNSYFWAVAAFFLMALFAIVTREALYYEAPLTVSFWTYFFGAFFMGVGVLTQKKGYLSSDRKRLLILRGLFGTAASFLYTHAITYISLLNSTLLLNTAPLFIPLLSVICLHEKVSLRTWGAVFIGFCGIVIILRPEWATLVDKGNILGLAAGFCLACAYLFMKALSSTEPALRIVFYYLGVGFLVQTPFYLFSEVMPDYRMLPFAAMGGALLTAAQCGIIKAYKKASAPKVGVFQYLAVVFVGVIDWYFWESKIDRQDLIGIALVIFAAWSLHK